jgi:cysteinyl-tRNA synthetase
MGTTGQLVHSVLAAPGDAAAPSVPGPLARPAAQGAGLAGVSRWYYNIDVNLRPETVEQIVSSTYDLVVLDFIPSEQNNTNYPMADVVSRLRNAPHPKRVLAYIDIGQAEDFRTYWESDWRIGDPEWIVGEDPDQWRGNYPVAYWEDDWHEIWLDEPDGYLNQIVAAGFDGVYLDWVEAYSHDPVRAAARRDGVDAHEEMVSWVHDIAEHARAQRPGFLVVGQNAAELVEDDDYVAVVDAIAQEQTWFDGAADDDPPGDCPLPRTRAEVDTEAYRASLPPRCMKIYDNPGSPLHVSSEEYVGYLTQWRAKGKPVLTVDYAVQPENVAWVYSTSRALGFIPFASNRHLNRFVPPVP